MFSKYAGAVGQGVADLFKSDPREEYKKLVLDELAKPSPDKPAAVRVLRTLLNNYHAEGDASTNTRTHSETAQNCVRILDAAKHPSDGITAAIAELNKIQKINAGRHFATLLNIYFSAFSEYLSECSPVVATAATTGTTWQDLQDRTTKDYVVRFMQNYDPNADDQYEKLAEVASMATPELAEQYKSFLDRQLQTNIAKEDFGLHKGWVYIAYSIIIPHLSEQARKDVMNTLQAQLTSANDFSTIGAGYALSQCKAYLPRKAYKEIADKLWSFAVQNINDYRETLSTDDKTVRLYCEQLFEALSCFSKQYGPEQKQSITRILTKQAEDAYAFKAGLGKLSDWFSDNEKEQTINAIVGAENIESATKRAVCNTLQNWVSAVQNRESAWSPFSKLKKESYELLSGSNYRGITGSDDVKAHAELLLQLMQSSNPTSEQERDNITNALQRTLEKADPRKSDELYIKVFDALGTLEPWVKDSKLIDHLFNCSHKGSHTTEYHMHAANAALQFRNELVKDNEFFLRDIIIAGLDDPKTAATACQMLDQYAVSTQVSHLPSLATSLAQKTSHGANLLRKQANALHTAMSDLSFLCDDKSERPAANM